MTKEQAIKKYHLKPYKGIMKSTRETKTLYIVYKLYKGFEEGESPYFMKIWRYKGGKLFGHVGTIDITE